MVFWYLFALHFTASKGHPLMKNLRDVLLITIDNDAEARLILMIATKAGMRVYRSAQFHEIYAKTIHSSKITKTDLARLGFDPLLVYGIGIMDDRYVEGLRRAGYDKPMIESVLSYREELERQIDPHYAERLSAAELAWKNRQIHNGVIVYASDNQLSISRLVSTIAIQHNVESKPSIIFCRGGKQLFVLNILNAQVERLNRAFPGRYTWTYGGGHCWGLNNEKSPKNLWVTIDSKDLVDLLTQAE